VRFERIGRIRQGRERLSHRTILLNRVDQDGKLADRTSVEESQQLRR
jgi:hypothetical protein